MLTFLVGLIIGGALGVTIFSLIYIGKYGQITDVELEAWEEHLKNSQKE